MRKRDRGEKGEGEGKRERRRFKQGSQSYSDRWSAEWSHDCVGVRVLLPLSNKGCVHIN